ncbi:hypothetical protein CspHIS471_0203400 [Cutaneotrichosporon sp. HIS471]|nr:hypothetical protein CspHIS471_0203400 [Cutaneotrichosporon sp. HIS471]
MELQRPQRPTPAPDQGDQGAKKKRRRIHLNCEECRRTKSKCNRSWPCSECVKKGMAHICPNQVSKVTQPKSVTISELTNRVQCLEDALRRNGLAHELETVGGDATPRGPRESSETASSPGGQVESGMVMAAMLGKLALGHVGTKRYPGMDTTAFYLSSPSESEDEESDGDGRTRSRRADAELWRPPWGTSRGISLTGRGHHLPGVLLDRCRAMLCSRRAAKDMFDKFFEVTSWRIQPMTPSFFDTVLASVYDSPEGAHPHDLAVLFATQAMTMLFDADAAAAAPGFQAVDYHQTAYSCLVAGNFYTETTLSSLVCLHLLGSFLINSDDKRLPDGIFPIIGLAVRLAVIAGYHRDAAPTHLSPSEIDWRRRVWHELLALERVHCLTALLPGSISTKHYDTPYPSDAHREGYFWWKWNLGRHMARVFDYWTQTETPDYTAVQDIDAGLRRFLHSLPPHLRCSTFPIGAFPLSRPGAPAVVVSPAPAPTPSPPSANSDYPSTISSERLTHQQYRMATHICMVFFYLHRPSFMRALGPGDTNCELSVRTVVEVCERMLELVKGILTHDQSMSRWFSFAADLFSVLLCQTVLVVKTTDPALAQSRIAVLEEGLAVLEWTATLRPNSKNRALVSRTRRLAAKAREAVARLPANNATAAINGFGLGVPGEGATVDVGPGIPLHAVSDFTVPSIPFFDFTVPKIEPELDLAVPMHLNPDLNMLASTPSDGSGASGVGHATTVPWSTTHGGMEMQAEPSFSMPLAPSTNDDQFDAWLAMLFPSGSESVVGDVVGDVVRDEWMDPSWNAGNPT